MYHAISEGFEIKFLGEKTLFPEREDFIQSFDFNKVIWNMFVGIRGINNHELYFTKNLIGRDDEEKRIKRELRFQFGYYWLKVLILDGNMILITTYCSSYGNDPNFEISKSDKYERIVGPIVSELCQKYYFGGPNVALFKLDHVNTESLYDFCLWAVVNMKRIKTT